MKKSLLLFLGLVLYSTTPSAKTLMMECFIFDGQESGRIHKMETYEDSTSKNLLTSRDDGEWKGFCHKNHLSCRIGDDSVIVVMKPTDTIHEMKSVYDFKFLIMFTEGVVSTDTHKNYKVNLDYKCKRINP